MLEKNYYQLKLKIRRKKFMSDEYTNNKIETKSADSSSGGYVPPADYIPAK